MTQVEQRFEDFSRAVAGQHSRKDALRLGFGFVAAAVAATLPGRAWAADPGGGNSAAAHFCNTVFPPGPDRGRCVQLASQGTGPFVECAGNPARFCGGACCPFPEEICCPGQPGRCGIPLGGSGCGSSSSLCCSGVCVFVQAAQDFFCQ